MNSWAWISALVVGVALGAWWGNVAAPNQPTPSPTPSGRPPLLELSEAVPETDQSESAAPARLETEAADRAGLEERIAALEARVTALSASVALVGEPRDGEAGDGKTQAARWFDEEGLRAAALRPETIAALRAEASAYEMEHLLLRDQAVREGWIRTPRYREALQESVDSVRSERGEDWFDWILYASGRPNRVLVEDVLGESPAARVGLKPGDVLRSYDSVPLYNPRDLQSGISEGEPGETVPLLVDRNDETVELYVPRGPLGIRLNASRVTPNTSLN